MKLSKSQLLKLIRETIQLNEAPGEAAGWDSPDTGEPALFTDVTEDNCTDVSVTYIPQWMAEKINERWHDDQE